MINFEMVHQFSKDYSVLYVEDDEQVRHSTEELFKPYFSSIDTAVDGNDALQKYKQYNASHKKYYDLVISDLKIPYIDGIELSDTILKINHEQTIVILSAYTDPMYLFELMNLGISTFISKPIELDLLHRVLYRACQTISKQKAELKRRESDKRERKFLMEVMELQDNIIVITDGNEIQSANQSLLDFFDFSTLEDFKQENRCISYTFMNEEEYFHLGLIKEDELWAEYMLKQDREDCTVMMQNRITMKRESFKVTVNYFHDSNKYIATFANITHIALKNKINKHQAIHDSLTGIYNRHKLHDLMQTIFSQAKDRSFAFILFDIDNYKQVNDVHGHLIGDQALKQLTSVIKRNIRESDIFVRWGGDEFILIIEDINNPEKAIKITEQLRHNIEQFIFDKVGQITCSFGVSLYRDGDRLGEMIGKVDRALYTAKNSGRNKVIYSEG